MYLEAVLDWLNDKPHKDVHIWYIGVSNGIRYGLDSLFSNLNKNKHILVGEPEIYDHVYYDGEILYIIAYKALPNLEYLESLVGNN